MKTTNNTKYIKQEKNTFIYSEQFFPKSKLYLFQMVKKEFIKNMNDFFVLNDSFQDITEPKKIKLPELEKKIIYNRFKELSEGMGIGQIERYENTIELDIVKAYYYTAYILGFIGKDFFLKCLELPKYIRLALIGSIATNKLIYNYEKGELIGGVENENNPELRKAWFKIVHYVDECLFDFYKLSGENFLLYWVDAIILKKHPEIEMDLRIIENKYNLKFEHKNLDWVEIVKTTENNYQFLVKESDKNKPKLFNCSKKLYLK